MELVAAFAFGVLHGLEPDHLVAISMLVVRGDGGGAARARVGLLFGLGHVAVLALATGLVLGLQAAIPPSLERVAEAVSGLLLLLLGIWALFGPRGEVVLHAHEHSHEGQGRHAHLHLHGRGQGHGHAHYGLVLGGIFAVGGVRSMVLVGLPALQSGSAERAVLAIVLFGLGIVLAMLGAGVVMARLARLLERRGHGAWRWTGWVTGTLAAGIGGVWLVRSLAG